MRINVLIFLFIFSGCAVIHAQELIPQQNEKGKYGFTDESGTFVIKPEFDDILFEFTQGVACVQVKKKYFFINAKGDKLSKKTYSWVGNFDKNNLCLVNNGGKINEKGEVEGGKFGYVNYRGEETVPVKYSAVGKFNEHGVASINQGGSYDKDGDFDGGKYGFVDLLGKELIPPKYTRIGDFDKDGITWVNIGGKEDNKTGEFGGGQFGYINNKGIEIVEPKYTFIGPFKDGICWVNKGGKIFVPEKDGTYKYKIKNYSQNKSLTRAFKDSLVNSLVGGKRDVRHTPIKGGKFGFLDIHGREIAKIKYTQTANHFTEDRAWVQLGKKYGYIDNSGKEITKIIYDDVSAQYHNGMAGVTLQKKWGFINHTGREVTKIEYQQIGQFESGFTWVKTNPETKKKVTQPSKYGLINENGVAITPFKYDKVKAKISEGLIGAQYNGGWCFVNEKGEEITPNHFLEVYDFDNGVAWARRSVENYQATGTPTVGEGFCGLINKNGEALTAFEYVHVNSFSDGLALVSKSREVTTSEAEEINKKSQEIVNLSTQLNQDSEAIGDRTKKITSHLTKKGVNKNLSMISELNTKLKKLNLELWNIKEKITLSGYINYKGETVIPFKYINGLPFKNGIAAVKNDKDQWGYINVQGEEFIPCQYASVSKEFRNGIAGVLINDKWGGVTMDGQLAIPARLDNIQYVFDITDSVYIPGGKQKLTEWQVKVFNLYKDEKRNSYSIRAIIPDTMWDF